MKNFISTLVILFSAINAAQAYDPYAPYAPNTTIREQQSAPSRPALKRYELIIKNRSYSPIISVYAKSVYMKNMSVDLIPNYSIRPGRQGLINLYDPDSETCDWYIKTVSADGSVNEKSLNVCNYSVLYIN